MQITRRDFINAACVSAILAVSGGLTKTLSQSLGRDKLTPIPPEAYADPLFSMNAKQLREFVGQAFTVTGPGVRPSSLVLTEVNVLERSQNTLSGCFGECFSLVFQGDVRRQLKQESYLMETAGLGSFTALLVPVGIERTRYEIIVNHLSR